MAWTTWGKAMPKFEETAEQIQHQRELATLRSRLVLAERKAEDDERLLRERAARIEHLEALVDSKPRMSHAGPGWQKRPA